MAEFALRTEPGSPAIMEQFGRYERRVILRDGLHWMIIESGCITDEELEQLVEALNAFSGIPSTTSITTMRFVLAEIAPNATAAAMLPGPTDVPGMFTVVGESVDACATATSLAKTKGCVLDPPEPPEGPPPRRCSCDGSGKPPPEPEDEQ